jgi:hypothetical protein
MKSVEAGGNSGLVCIRFAGQGEQPVCGGKATFFNEKHEPFP